MKSSVILANQPTRPRIFSNRGHNHFSRIFNVFFVQIGVAVCWYLWINRKDFKIFLFTHDSTLEVKSSSFFKFNYFWVSWPAGVPLPFTLYSWFVSGCSIPSMHLTQVQQTKILVSTLLREQAQITSQIAKIEGDFWFGWLQANQLHVLQSEWLRLHYEIESLIGNGFCTQSINTLCSSYYLSSAIEVCCISSLLFCIGGAGAYWFSLSSKTSAASLAAVKASGGKFLTPLMAGKTCLIKKTLAKAIFIDIVAQKLSIQPDVLYPILSPALSWLYPPWW